MNEIIIPADVPPKAEQEFIANYRAITRNSNHLFIFSCDQKIEHLHDAFDPHNPAIHPDAIHPEHLFQIAHQGDIGAMATQLELIARYGKQYPGIHYIAKINSKTNLIPADQQDPLSAPLWDLDDVLAIKKDANLAINGIGVTVYLGSEFEEEMLSFAAQALFDAHQQGLIGIVWMYPRGKAITHDTDAHLLAGAAGAANALGADFVKIKPPSATSDTSSAEALQEIVAAAGNTKVICAGGSKLPIKDYVQILYDQLNIGNTAGAAIGRNIFQRSLPEAIALTRAISSIVYDGLTPQKAMALVKE